MNMRALILSILFLNVVFGTLLRTGLKSNLSTTNKAKSKLDNFNGYSTFTFTNNKVKTDTTSQALDDLLKWGTYKPQLISAITQRNTEMNSSLNLAMMYYNTEKLTTQEDLMFKMNQRKSVKDLIQREVSDGLNFSKQRVKEDASGFEFVNTFLKMKSDRDNHQWIYKVTKLSKGKSLGIVLAFSVINLDPKYDVQKKLSISEIKEGIYQIKASVGKSVPEVFHVDVKVDGSDYKLFQKKDKTNKITYNVIERDYSLNWDIQQTIFEDITGKTRSSSDSKPGFFSNILGFLFGRKKTKAKPVLKANLKNDKKEEKQGSLAYINFNLPKDFNFEITVQYIDNGASYIAESDEINDLLQYKTLNANEEMNSKFNLSRALDDDAYCAKRSFAELIGGLQYSYGSIKCEQTTDPNCSKNISILTHTPARIGFPRPFLWDEGFHSLITFNYYPSLPKIILTDWFNTMNESTGWIPREQPRGAELQSYIPWLKEDDREANPPSFMFVIRRFLYEYSETSIEEVKVFFDENWSKIKKWFDWWYNLQGVFDPKTKQHLNMFKWWGPDPSSNLGSGMDDYPRSDGDYISYANIDATCWAYFFSQVMIEIMDSNYVKESETYINNIRNINSSIKDNILKKFFDKDNIAKDILVHKTDSSKHKFSPHLGYINAFPLIFGIIEDNSKELDSLLGNLLGDKEQIWTDFGLSSLSKKDPFYGKDSNYWRGPIWININYLILRGIKRFYSKNLKAINFYTYLRRNLIGEVCGRMKDHGYFFEIFNQDHDGLGNGNNPFNGWTSLITLIIGEIYE